MQVQRSTRNPRLSGFVMGLITAAIIGGSVAAAGKADLVDVVNEFLNVQIINTPAEAVPVAVQSLPASGRVPFQASVQVVGSGDTTAAIVPEGQRLVITYINSRAAGTVIGFIVNHADNSKTRFFYQYVDDYLELHPTIIVEGGATLSIAEGSPTEPVVVLVGYTEPE